MRRAGNLRSIFRAKEYGEGADLFDGDKLLCGLRLQDDFVNDFFLGHAARLGGVGNLFFHERRFHITGTDGVAGDVATTVKV